jgi:hypothetical protein
MEAYVVRRGGKPVEQPLLSTAELAQPPQRRRKTDFPAWGASGQPRREGQSEAVGEVGGQTVKAGR